jgi:putative FmdB family regulatory protein
MIPGWYARVARRGPSGQYRAVPIYEYQCQKCERVFEYQQSMSEKPKAKCERCGGKLDKLLSAAGFVLKGGGWYKDLYASSKPESGGGDDAGDSKAEAKPDTKADAKADTKTEAKPETSSLGRKAAPPGGSSKKPTDKPAKPAAKKAGKRA